MTDQPNASVGCLLIGEYVDEAELPAGVPFREGEAVRPRLIAEYLDLSGLEDVTREFTVLLKDGRVVAVRGHGLKHCPPTAAGECACYGVVVRSAGEEVLVALFHALEVVGIFHGDLRSDRKIA